MRIIIGLLLLVLVFPAVSSAEGCPPSASDCFLCGGVDGIPCSMDCPGGPDRPGIGPVACECPQGEPCTCYCPYGGGEAQVKDETDLIAEAPPCEAIGCKGKNCAAFESMQGTVAVMKEGGWCIASEGIGVTGGTKVWVLEGSKVRIRLYNGAIMDVDKNSVFHVEKLETVGEGATGKMVMKMVEGAYHFLFDKDRIEQFEVRMDTVVVGIKGTEFVVEADGSDLTVKVLEGRVRLANDGSSKSVVLEEGEMATAPLDGGEPTEPIAFDSSQEERWWSGLESEGSGCSSAFILLISFAGATGFFLRNRFFG